MAVDETMRPLKIPPKFIPYLETHHVYYTFHSMCRYILKYRPDDVLQFMRSEFIAFKNQRSATKRVIFIAPGHFNIEDFAADVAMDIDGVLINLNDVVNEFKIPKNDKEPIYDPELLAKSTREYIDKHYYLVSWILVDFPRTKAEAIALQKQFILPTHVIEFKHTPKDYSSNDLWNENLGGWTYKDFHAMLVEFKYRAHDLREVYKSCYNRVIIRGRKREKIVNECVDLLFKFPFIGAPLLPRVVLIGPRGSRRKTIAIMLSKRFKLVHVDFQTLLSKATLMVTNSGLPIHDGLSTNSVDIIFKLLEERFLEQDCVNNGWVLTGFPNDETDFKLLDSIQTPPNRIIILDICNMPCNQRLQDRLINVYSGEVQSRKNNENDYLKFNQLAQHPADKDEFVLPLQERYTSEIQDMLDYSEHKAMVIDATGPINELFERVVSVIMYPNSMNITRRLEQSQSLYNQFQSSVHDFVRQDSFSKTSSSSSIILTEQNL